MKEERIIEILNKVRQVKVAVYGDFCLDVYWEMQREGSEISVETGQRAEAVRRHYYSPGGAGNVTANLAALEPAEIRALGIIGPDIYGEKLLDLLSKKGIQTQNLIQQSTDFDTYAFVKKYLDNEELSRTDFGTKNKRSSQTDAQVLASIKKALEECDALIFNQQVPDSISNPEFISGVQDLFLSHSNKVILVDSRHITGVFKEVFYKTNELELRQLELGTISSKASTNQCASHLSQMTGRPVFVTRGAAGILVAQPDEVTTISGLPISAPIDTVGAGDTAVSALALCLGVNIAPEEAAHFANLAAGVTIQKLQMTGTARGTEILALNKSIFGN